MLSAPEIVWLAGLPLVTRIEALLLLVPAPPVSEMLPPLPVIVTVCAPVPRLKIPALLKPPLDPPCTTIACAEMDCAPLPLSVRSAQAPTLTQPLVPLAPGAVPPVSV